MDSQDLTASPAANALAPSGAPTDAPDDALPVPLKPLTPRQERFCHYFVAYANAAHAAREAGFSPKSAKHQGYRLLRTGRVRARIRALHAELARDHAGNADALIGKLENLYRRATEARRFHTATRAVEMQARLAMCKERQRLPALPPLPLPSLGRPADPPAQPSASDADDPALARMIARAEAMLERIDAPETGPETGEGPASVGNGGHPVGTGSAPGGPEVGGGSARG